MASTSTSTTSTTSSTSSIARAANATNNAMHQQLRLERWSGARDALWNFLEPHLAAGARVALVGAGSCDDVPLARIAQRASMVDLIDFDGVSLGRALERASFPEHVRPVVTDVTGGCADNVLDAARDGAALPDALPLPHGPLTGDHPRYDLVIGDMLYTQLLHSGLIALGIVGDRQLELMRRYDPHLVRALVTRIHASVVPGGIAVHVHDVACWTSEHPQPVGIDAALAEPDEAWAKLRRHDACDPHLVAESIGPARIVDHAWWQWPFEPNKQFLVRASAVRVGREPESGRR